MLRALAPALVALAGLLAAACGGASDVPRPSSERVLATPPNQCDLAAAYTDTLSVTAFDGQGTTVLCGNPPDVICSFYTNEDTAHAPHGSLEDSGSDCVHQIYDGQFVDGGVNELAANVVPEPSERCGQATSVGHFTAANLGMCVGSNGRRGWGAGYEIDFGPSAAKAPIDASPWDGYSFWIKRGPGASEGSIIVLTVDNFGAGVVEQVDPATGQAVSCASKEPAIQALAEPDASKCDPFAAGVTISDDWTFVPIRFAELRQKGFGMPAPEGLDVSQLLRLQFLVTAGNWDFYLDDVAFFREP
jgi:hypothetical protein